jgi:hypothetical protein
MIQVLPLGLGPAAQPLPRSVPRRATKPKAAAVPPDYYYWDGQILKAKDGKYHLFMSTWAGSAGFNRGWLNSDAYHAISSQGVLGPYSRQGYVYTNSGSHKGHNVSDLHMDRERWWHHQQHGPFHGRHDRRWPVHGDRPE